jgi:hypothetical protein
MYILYEVNCRSLLIDYYRACFVRRACMKGERYEVKKKSTNKSHDRDERVILFYK